MPSNVVIIGAGGGSRDILDIINACNAITFKYNVLGFLVDPGLGAVGSLINGKPILGGFEWLADHITTVQVLCGVGAPEIRHRLISRAQILGVSFCTVIHPSVIMSRSIEIGQGSSIGAGCILTNQIKIGNHVQINIGCTISHDVTIEDFVTLSPGVHLGGNVAVGEGCFVGLGTNCIEKKRLGKWSIVGAGATIISDVPANTTVVGGPGKVIKTRTEGWHLS